VPRRLTPAGRARDLGRLLLVGGFGLALLGGIATVRIWQQGATDERRPVDAIVVLGAAQYDGRPSPVFKARLDHAIALWHAGLAPRFVVTGGGAEGDRTTEAAVARQYALDHDVPAEAIVGEDRGRTTLESLRAVAELLEDRGAHTVLLVSDPTHMLRAIRMAEDLGLTAYGSPTPGSPVARDPRRTARATVHELGALAIYFLAGGTPTGEAAAP
jgi:uncharacterized SAM-binding protein YcdF (DUF218 family)